MRSATSAESQSLARALADLSCQRCGLARLRTQVVPAEGPSEARLMVVGEAPGPDEDEHGRPFIGRAGRILRQCLGEAGVPVDGVWITNVVKCFPHERSGGKNRIRRPAGEEIRACGAFLESEVRVVRPSVVVALGATAANAMTDGVVASPTKMRGHFVPAAARFGKVTVLVTIHPAALRFGHATRAQLAADLRMAYLRASSAPS